MIDIMPLRAFVSYQRDDLQFAQLLERTLHASGIRAWRDLEFLPFGSRTEAEVIRAINEDCGAFVVLITELSLASDFIWRVEIPAAITRANASNGAFAVIPIFIGPDLLARFSEKSRKEVGQDLSLQNGIILDSLTDHAGLTRLSGRLLEDMIRPDEYTRVRIFTHGDIPTSNNRDVVIDLRTAFEKDVPSRDDWTFVILPGLRNVKRALLHKNRPQRSIWLPSRIHLSAALAFGWVFREVTGFTLDPSDDLKLENPESLLDPGDLPPANLNVVHGDINRDNLAVAVSLAKDVRPSLREQVRSQGYGYRAAVELTAEPIGPTSVVNTTHARQLAQQTVQVLLAQKDRFRTRETDLFVSSSVQFAAFLGYYLNASGYFRFWQFSMVNGSYKPGVDLSILFDNDS